MTISDSILDASETLKKQVDSLEFSSPTHTVYNPLHYAWDCWEAYIRKYANHPKKVVFLGMNPGPWGMAQIGVPFGEISLIRDWVGIHQQVSKPENEHPKRPIEGFNCQRSEVSGRRLWGLFKTRFAEAPTFFEEHFVLNYCPLVFMEDSGRNRTPDKLLPEERKQLYAYCDDFLQKVIQLLEPKWLIGVGKFAAARAEIACNSKDLQINWILHPSPASPAANKDWAGFAQKKMAELGVWS